MVKGIYPYVSPSEGMSEDMIIQAWFKKGTAPAQSVDSDVFNLAGLSSFDVSLSGQSITFNFAPYNPETPLLMKMLMMQRKHLVKLFIQLSFKIKMVKSFIEKTSLLQVEP